MSATELIYLTDQGISTAPSSGGGPLAIGKLNPALVLQFVADANYVYVLTWKEIARFARH